MNIIYIIRAHPNQIIDLAVKIQTHIFVIACMLLVWNDHRINMEMNAFHNDLTMNNYRKNLISITQKKNAQVLEVFNELNLADILHKNLSKNGEQT